jgi:uncharacterized protein (DUF433 family)
MAGPDLLRTGIYTARDAAALIGVPPQKIRAWITGWPRTVSAPILDNDLGWVNRRLAFSFANLMELRFIAFFEGAGVKLNEIRNIMDEARDAIRRPHPFATNIVFKTDGVKIVAEIAHRNGVPDLLDLRSRNYEMGVIVYKTLKDGVIYDPKGDAEAWVPRRKIAPNIIIHPRLAFGRPVLKDRGIPTEAIANTARAEGSIEAAAAMFEIPLRRAREAVSFEEHLRAA